MNRDELNLHIAEATRDADLADTDVPAIDLYLDQILSLVAARNEQAAPRYRERALTKTMVNNYSKEGLISAISGKKYSREQIIEILLVYALKNTLSIGEIKRMLHGARSDCGFTGSDLIDSYHRFLGIKENNRGRTREFIERLLAEDGLDIADDKDFFVMLLDILSLSAYLKTAAQELLEARYTDPDDAQRAAREQEKAEKRAEEARERREKDAEKAEKKGKKEKKHGSQEPTFTD